MNRYCGDGNMAFCAAHAARERVLVLEKAPREWADGNTCFTAGFRTTFLEELPSLLDLSEELLARTGVSPYARDDFLADPAEEDLR